MLPLVQDCLSRLRAHEDRPSDYESGHGYWDDYCLAKFFEGLCFRYAAHTVRLGGFPQDTIEHELFCRTRMLLPSPVMLSRSRRQMPKCGLSTRLISYWRMVLKSSWITTLYTAHVCALYSSLHSEFSATRFWAWSTSGLYGKERGKPRTFWTHTYGHVVAVTTLISGWRLSRWSSWSDANEWKRKIQFTGQ